MCACTRDVLTFDVSVDDKKACRMPLVNSFTKSSHPLTIIECQTIVRVIHSVVTVHQDSWFLAINADVVKATLTHTISVTCWRLVCPYANVNRDATDVLTVTKLFGYGI